MANENIKIINLTNDIQADRTLRITRAVTINGQNGAKTITFENKDGLEYENAGEIRLENINLQINGNVGGWQGIYALQVYGATNAALKNVTATGADAGILVNGSNVSLEGIVNVTGNEFGGIEVAKGLDAEDNPRLSGTAANLKNDTEESGKPTIWIDKVSELTKAVVAVSGLTEGTTDKDQAHYFISESAAVTSNVSNLSELETALANGNIKIINLTNDIQADKTLEVTRPLTINGQNGAKTISFDNKNGMQLVNSGETRLENVNLQITQNAPGWQGIYALQVYGATNAVLKNVTATGADGGILVNGSDVSLEGIVNVTGNEFGGIEVAKGALAEKMPRLSGTSENLKNDTEEAGKPTIWIDKVSELTNAVVAVSGLNEAAASNDQTHFYLGEAPEIIK